MLNSALVCTVEEFILVDGYLTRFLVEVNTRASIKSGAKQCALSLDGALGDGSLADGEYAVNYLRVSNHTGKFERPGMDKLTVLAGSILFEAKPGHSDPLLSQRKTMKFATNDGLIIATGDLQYEGADPLMEITFQGVIGTNFLISTISGRDIVMLHLTSW